MSWFLVIVILLATAVTFPIALIWLVVNLVRESRGSASYSHMRWHTATLNGESVRFRSYFKRGTRSLSSDAVEACRQAGIYERAEDADAILVDGDPIADWENGPRYWMM